MSEVLTKLLVLPSCPVSNAICHYINDITIFDISNHAEPLGSPQAYVEAKGRLRRLIVCVPTVIILQGDRSFEGKE